MTSLTRLQIKPFPESQVGNSKSETLSFGDMLGTEIWVMILEHLCLEKRPFAPKSYYLRLVSKRFNAIATPFIYRNFVLSNKLIASRPDPVSSRISASLKTYTRRAFVFYNNDLNIYRVTKFLTDCRALRDVHWTYFSNHAPLCLPLPIQLAFSHELIQVQLRIEIYDPLIRRNRGFELASVPAANLSTLEMWDVLKLDQDGDKFNALVAAAKKLKTLRIPRGMVFSTSHGKLPAIKKLILRDAWQYQPEAIVRIFNFSRLATLVLECEVDIPLFVDAVRDVMFSTLRKIDVTEDDLFWEDDQAFGS